jgi:ribosomal protein S18 acetylase RimI-like enzyme
MAVLARATTWDMDWFGRRDAKSRLGLLGVEVAPAHRRKGYGRFLVGEILRTARELAIGAVQVQTTATNLPALGLYQALGFQPIDQSTVYRLPAHLLDRSRGS